jgi:Integrase core domain
VKSTESSAAFPLRPRNAPSVVPGPRGGAPRPTADAFGDTNRTTIAPGRLIQNGFIESFNGRFRVEFLNELLFSTLTDARNQIATWKDDYNTDIDPIPPSGTSHRRSLP